MFNNYALAQRGGTGEDAPDEYESEEALPYVGLGAGYTAIVSFMNLDKLNDINRQLRIEDFKGPLALHSGNIVFSPGFMPNWRLGGYGAGGYKTASSTVTLQGKPFIRSISFTTGQGGLMIDRAIRINQKLTILPGLIAGVGTYAYSMAQTPPDGSDFSTIISLPDSGGVATASLNRYGRFLATHVMVHPHIYAEYAITGRFMVRAGVGYSVSAILGSWTDIGGVDIGGFPEIKADGPTLHIGIFGGLWQE